MHFLLVCGIIGVAVSFEKIIAHPHDVLTVPIFYALCGGYVFFVGFTGAAVYRASKLILLPRLLILIVSMIGIYFTIGSPTYYALGIIAFSLILLIFIEWKKCRHS